MTVTLVIAALEAFVYFRIGSREAGSESLLAVIHVLGSVFYSILTITLLPFASLSLFIYERQFYSVEVSLRKRVTLMPTGIGKVYIKCIFFL